MAEENNASSVALEEPVSESTNKEEENRVRKSDQHRQVSNSSDCTTLDDALTREGKGSGASRSETLASVPSSKSDRQFDQSSLVSELAVECTVKPLESVKEVKDQEKAVHEESTNSSAGASAQFQRQVPDGPSRLELSPTSVTQPLSSNSGPTQPQQKLQQIPNGNKRSITEGEKQKPPLLKLSPVPLLKTPSDGYNWRKYGQKQVKSPEGSRSYYRCTSSDCHAKKIECSDPCHRVIETVYRSHHNHDPPPKLNCSRENRSMIQSPNATGRGSTNASHPVKALNDIMPSTSKEPLPGIDQIPETKQQESNDSDETMEINAKDGHVDGPEYKKRKKEAPPDQLGILPKPVNKPKFVVHAADDVGISGDGYRWRKYGQKMVKGNPHPRNYYRCTSAGCPVRKHIEKAVDSTTAQIITYKGGHNHDMPVPKKRPGPRNTRISGTSVPGVSLQTDKSEIHPSQKKPPMDKEGISSDGALHLIAKKKAESTPALLSVGFEIKPCSNH